MYYHDANTSLKGLTELQLYNGIKCTIMLTLHHGGHSLKGFTELKLYNGIKCTIMMLTLH